MMQELLEHRFNELLAQFDLAWYHIAEVPLTVAVVVTVFVVFGFAGAAWLFERGGERLGLRPRPALTAAVLAACFVGLAMEASVGPFLIGWCALALFAPFQLIPAWRRNPARARFVAALAVGFGVVVLALLVFDRWHHDAQLRARVPALSAFAARGGAGVPSGGRRFFDDRQLEARLRSLFGGFHITEERWHEAATFVLIEGRQPHLVVAYLVIADLTHPGLEILITPQKGAKSLTSAFAEANGADVAVNGEAGLSMKIDALLGKWTGNWIVRGRPVLLEDSDDRPFLSFDSHNRARYVPAAIVDRAVTEERYNTIWGRHDAIVGGEVQVNPNPWGVVKPRTLMGIDANGETLYLLVIDGRQPDYSLGMRLYDAAQLLAAFGATDAMACDEGGSSVMWVKHLGGIVSEPSDGEERPTYTHFGLRLGPGPPGDAGPGGTMRTD
jgi:hypothetical protein